MTIYSLGTPFPIWNQSVVPCPVLTVASWPAYRFLRCRSSGLGFPSLSEFSTVCCDPHSLGFSILVHMVTCSQVWDNLGSEAFLCNNDLTTPSWGALYILSQISPSVSNIFSVYVALSSDWQLPRGRSLFILLVTVSLSCLLPGIQSVLSKYLLPQ